MADKLTFEQWWACIDINEDDYIRGIAETAWDVALATDITPEPAPTYELVPCNYKGSGAAIKALLKGDELFAANGKAVNVQYSDYGLAAFAGGVPIRYDHLFRREPVRMKTAVYPMPETKAPENGTVYFFQSRDKQDSTSCVEWFGSKLDYLRLGTGNVFLKREHAQAKADAQAVEVSE
jgi:hypothetical protein